MYILRFLAGYNCYVINDKKKLFIYVNIFNKVYLHNIICFIIQNV
jgi:hypothetical protein